MSITNKAAILKLFMVLPGVFCFADIHSAYEQAVRVYTEYRKVRIQCFRFNKTYRFTKKFVLLLGNSSESR